jgi:hypothetical protein
MVDRNGNPIVVGEDYVLVAPAVENSAGRVTLDTRPRSIVVEEAGIVSFRELRATETVLAGSAIGGATSIPLSVGGVTPSADLAIPVTTARRSVYIAIAMRHASAGAGEWSATFFRTRDGVTAAIAEFNFAV